MDNNCSLYELTTRVKEIVNLTLADRYWVTAELSEVNEHATGHCYIECIEKGRRNAIVAKCRGTIWASTFSMLKPYFEQETGHRFGVGIKVLIEVSVSFHEVYGFSLNVHDINPTYTLGDMAAQRAAIIRQLTEEGIIDMNRELIWKEPPRSIAIISSASAAGYGDFMRQLHENDYGYRFCTTLFNASMQGEHTEQSVISALERIYSHIDLFDAVVIIRGGGATSDLNCFDSYEVAAHITQFPLPVIVGIGHDRDTTVLDRVAHTAVKTPTAAAQTLINIIAEFDTERISLQNELAACIQRRLHTEEAQLRKLQYNTAQLATQVLHTQQQQLAALATSINNNVTNRLTEHNTRLNHIKQIVEMLSPENLLRKGYSITLCNGKAVRDISQLHVGDELTTILTEGEVKSIVNS